MDPSSDTKGSIYMSQSPSHLHPSASPLSERQIPSSSASPLGFGTSTSVEAVTPLSEEQSDPVSRHAASRNVSDVERQSQPAFTPANDPYRLSSGYKTPDELEAIRANTSRKRDGYGALTLNRAAHSARKLQGFYETQNSNIERLLKPVDEHLAEARQEQGENLARYKIAVYGSFAANVALAALQIYGATTSGSLSLYTTAADAIFDPLSNLTLIVTNRAVRKVDASRFPSGKARLETVGNIAFCFIMTSVSMILIALSAEELARGSAKATQGFHLPSVIAVCVAFVTKLVLFLYCWALKDVYSQVMILWKDHRNDLLINGFGILTSVGGSKLAWWIDPMGAILLSLLVSALWLRTAFAEVLLLVGVSAAVEVQQLITYVSLTHSDEIVGIDTVRCYHSGPRLIAEVDVVMAAEATLRQTHDVAEALQMKLESLPDIERAYVHVDYEVTHKPEHFLKKVL